MSMFVLARSLSAAEQVRQRQAEVPTAQLPDSMQQKAALLRRKERGPHREFRRVHIAPVDVRAGALRHKLVHPADSGGPKCFGAGTCLLPQLIFSGPLTLPDGATGICQQMLIAHGRMGKRQPNGALTCGRCR